MFVQSRPVKSRPLSAWPRPGSADLSWGCHPTQCARGGHLALLPERQLGLSECPPPGQGLSKPWQTVCLWLSWPGRGY